MNLFPVKLDLKPLVDAWGNVVRFVLWQGLRYVYGGSSSIPDRTGEPSNMPDDGLEDIDVFFLHGFNVSEADARNWSRQVFKRLWLSGSRARFHGFSWYGDYVWLSLAKHVPSA